MANKGEKVTPQGRGGRHLLGAIYEGGGQHGQTDERVSRTVFLHFCAFSNVNLRIHSATWRLRGNGTDLSGKADGPKH